MRTRAGTELTKCSEALNNDVEDIDTSNHITGVQAPRMLCKPRREAPHASTASLHFKCGFTDLIIQNIIC